MTVRLSEVPSSPWRNRIDRAARYLLPARPVTPVPRWESLAGRLRSRTARRLMTFGAIGVVSTLAYVVLYALLREGGVSPELANATALIATAVANTAANRRLTFDVQGRDGLARHHAIGLLALGVALVITSASLAGLHVATHTPSRALELTVLIAANAAATLARFLMLRLVLERPTLAEDTEMAGR